MEMEFEKRLKGFILIGICISLIISVLFVGHHEYFAGFHVLYGAIGVGFFMVTTKTLSVIQREGEQDD